MMTGLHSGDVVAAVRIAMDSGYTREGVSRLTPEDYLIENTSERVVKFILSTVHRHHQWSGVR
jgi:UDP-N-acetylglucosamine 2-epimerase (non-hydrolysing)